MSDTINELKSTFYTKGETFTRDETIAMVATATTGDLGPVTTAGTPIPGIKAGQSYSISAHGVYGNFPGIGGAPVNIPAPAANEVIYDSRLYYNGTYWVPDVKIKALPVNNNKIVPWVAGAYTAGEQTSNLGRDWVANANTTAADIPGSSSKWIERLTAYLGADKIVYEETSVQNGNQLFDKTAYLADTSVSSSGVLASYPAAPSSLNARTMKIHVDPNKGGGNIRLSGFQHLGTAAYRWVFHDVNGVKLTNGNIGAESLTTVSVPAGAYWFYCLFRHATIDDNAAGDNLMVNVGNIALPREDYQAPTVVKKLVSVNGATVINENAFNNYALKTFVQELFAFYGKKWVSIGNSITNGGLWQPVVAALTGLLWSITETQVGTGGHARMGLGGSRIVPEVKSDGAGGYITGQGPGQSIYIRSRDAHFYSPDIITVKGGQNDGRENLGSITDAPYLGEEFLDTAPVKPSFVSCYKGMLEQLIASNPTAKIIVLTPYYTGTNAAAYTSAVYASYKSRNDLIKAICEMYSIRCVDLMSGLGFHPLNNATYLSDGIHPNVTGGQRMGKYIADFME